MQVSTGTTGDKGRRRCCTAALLVAMIGGWAAALSAYDMPVRLPGPPARLRWPLQAPDRPATVASQGLYLRMTAFSRTGTVKPVAVSIEFVNGRGEWYQTARNLSIGFNAPRAIVLDMCPDSADWVPSGHFRPWDEHALEGMVALQLRITASEPIDLKIKFTPPVWHRGAAPIAPSAGVVAWGVDRQRYCVRLQPVPGAAMLQSVTARWPEASAPGFIRQAYVAGAVGGEWHPVGGSEWAWHPPPGVGYGPPAAVMLEDRAGRVDTLGLTQALAGGGAVAEMTPQSSGTPPPDNQTVGAETLQSLRPVTAFGSALSQLSVAGRPLVGISGPDPARTGQPARWWLYRERQWQSQPDGPPLQLGWAWRAPNFMTDTVWLADMDSREAACLNAEIAWAWEEALVAAERLGVKLPAVVWADRDLYDDSAFRWGLNPWRKSGLSPRQLFATEELQQRQRRVFAALTARFGHRTGVRDWLVGLTLPIMKETALTTVYGLEPPTVAVGTRVWLSHPACQGEAPALWAWNGGQEEWSLPKGWRSVEAGKQYATQAPRVEADGIVIAAPTGGRSRESETTGGTARLVLRADPNAKTADNRFADNLAGASYLDVDMEALGTGVDGRVSIDIVTGDWLRYQALSPELLAAGQPTRVRFALGDDSPLTPMQWDLATAQPISRMPVEGAGAAALPPWRGYRLRRVREMVVSFHRSSGPAQARILGMAVYPTRPGEALTAPAVNPLPPSAGGTARPGQVLTFEAQVTPEPHNPYDLEEVDLRLCVTGPAGVPLEIPAFWFEPQQLSAQPVTVGGKSIQAETIVPSGIGRFRAQWRPAEAGRFALEWRLYRGSRFVVQSTQVFDYRYTENGEGRPFPRKDYMERTLLEDNRSLKTGPKLYGAEEANRPVERLQFVDGTVAARAALEPVTVGEGVASRYVRIAQADPRQFEFSDGRPYYPIGVNARSPSDARVPFKAEKNGRYDAAFFEALDRRATLQFEEFFAAYAAHGINWARVWMSSWWLALEWRRDFPGYGGVGDYNQRHAARLDHLIAEAERQGIYLQITLNNHGMYAPEIDTQWADNPYNAERGGPCASMQDFFSRAEPQKWHLMRLRYIAARWGSSPAVHGWEICSEVEFVGEYSAHYFDYERGLKGRSAAVLDAWHTEVAAWLKRWDTQGRHLVTTHYSHPYQGQSTLALPAMEVPMANAYSAYLDLYSTGEDSKNNCRASVAADAYWNGFRDPNSKGVFGGFKQYGKPVLVGEHGRHWMGVDMRYKVGTPNTSENLEADMHCMLWAMYMRPYAGDTGFWWWLPLHFEPGWLEHYAALAQFAAGEDRRGRVWDRFDGRSDREALGCMALVDSTAGVGYGWVYEKSIEQSLRSATRQTGAQVTLPLKSGRYVLEFWRTRKDTGTAQKDPEPKSARENDDGLIERRELEVPAGAEEIGVQLPAFTGDLALKIRRVTEGERR